MAQSVRSLFMSRVESYFHVRETSIDVLPSIIEALTKYDCLISLFRGFTTLLSRPTPTGSGSSIQK